MPSQKFVNTSCPGIWERYLAWLDTRANQILTGQNPTAPAPQAFDIEQAARAVIAGKYGNGEQRKSALGANYQAVQARVNEILSGKPTPNIDALAREVLAGKYGNGAERRQALGANYEAVQARVNEILGV
ncbi:hypothetical protein RQN30_02270 [Arcanobacterium hippocoleae]